MGRSTLIPIRCLLILAALAWGSAAIAGPPDWFQWLDKEVLKRVKLNGYRILGLHAYSVSGDKEAFNNLTYYGLGYKTFTDFGQLRVQGQNVAGLVNFQAQILDSRFDDPQGQKFSLDYARGGWSVDAGDILGTLNYNRFAYFTKSLRGISVGYTKGRFTGKVLRTQAKGSARTITIQGNNSSGPYYLQTNQVVRGSEQVQVDGQDMQPVRDYVMNYELGSLTFINKIVAPSSSIVVTFEALGFNTTPGIVQGIGLSYDFGKLGKLGVTGLQQIARGGGAGSTVLESFEGFGPPSTPYILQFEPAPGSTVIIKVDGVQQVAGRDYSFDVQNPSIFYMARFVPSTSVVDVIYTPKPRGTVDGDRESLGMEYSIPLGKKGKNGQLSYSQAIGRLKSDLTPLSGVARGLNLKYNTGHLQLSGSLRDVPADFVTVETRGFNRNDRAADWQINYNPNAALNYGLSASNSSVAIRSTTSTGDSKVTRSRFTIAKAFATFRPEHGGSWSAEQRRTESSYVGRETKIDSTELTYSRMLGKVDTHLSYERQDGSGPVQSGTSLLSSKIHLDTLRLGASYALSDTLTLSGNASVSAINSGGNKGTGKDWTLVGTYQPNEKLRVSTEYSLSDSGALAALNGFQNGYGLGFDGNGFSGGVGTGFTLGATNYKLFKITSEYSPTDRFSLNADVTNMHSEGSISSNSDTTAIGFGGNFDFGRGHQLSITLDESSTRFVDSSLTSRATNLNAYWSATPPGRLSYRIGASLLLSGGNSTFKQDSANYEGSLTYRIGKRQNLNFNIFTGSTTGYYPQDTFNASLIYQYQIWHNLALNVGYKFNDIRNRDPKLTSGAYKAAGFDLELNFNFGGN